MEHNVQIDFQLLGTTVLPNDISHMTGITPDDEWVKGERNKKLGLPKCNIWSIRSHAKSDELTEHWLDLSEKLVNSKSVIKDIAETGTVKFTLIVNSSERIPPLTIPPEMSEFAGFVGAEIDIDHYC